MIQPLNRAHHALQGLAVGDSLGAYFEFSHGRVPYRIRERQLPRPPWSWTDDTQLALGTYAILERYGRIDQDALAIELAQNFVRGRGYGAATRAILSRVRRGEHWQDVAPRLYGGTGTYGNGRLAGAAVVGAFFADHINLAIEQAQQASMVTHCHLEALAGAAAIACASAVIWQEASVRRDQLFQMVLEHTPESQTRQGIVCAAQMTGVEVREAAAQLGNGSRVTVQDTAPFALWCIGEKIGAFEEAIWLTLNGLGDCDTTGAIVGGVVAGNSTAIPPIWQDACERIDLI